MPGKEGEPRPEVIEEDKETKALRERASKFIDTEGKSLEYIARELDDSFDSKVENDEILEAKSLEELQERVKKNEEARKVYREITKKLFDKKE